MAAIPQKPVGGSGAIGGITIGSADFQEQGENFVLDPQYGTRATLNVEGALSRLLPQGYLYYYRGYHVEINQIGETPQYKMAVRFPDLNDGAEVPTVRWKIDSQIEDVDIFTLPDAAVEMSFFNPPAKYRKLLVDATKNGSGFPPEIDTSVYPFAPQLYQWLIEGVRAFPQTRHTLTRIRTMSWAFPTPFVIQIYPDVYTTDALIDVFQIPDYIAMDLPSGTGDLTPPGREWGWLQQHRDTDSLMAQTFKKEETVTWLFAPCEVALFNFIG